MKNSPNIILKRFENDLTEWKPIPFWSWNDKLEPEELCRQIDWMKRNEIGGFFMHARGGLKTEYLSNDWMTCIKACAEHSNKAGMNAWVYDENGWPSGFAGGKLLEDAENCDQYIIAKEGEFDSKATVIYFLGEDSIKRVLEPIDDGIYLNLYIKTSVSTADILDPKVVEKFLNLTHQSYKEQFGDDFSTKIKGFFTDEPQYFRTRTPFSKVMYSYYKELYDEDILDELGLLFVEKEGYRRFRYRYWKAMQTLMINGFGKMVYNWCEENGVKLTGHYVQEDTLVGQMHCCAGIMPFYKYMSIPGIDWLGVAANNERAPRQLASVAAQYGKKQALTETFASCGWELSPRDAKRIADFQFVNGVNLLCHHLLPYAEYGQRKRDYPAHYSEVNPWIEYEFAGFNEYFTRLGYILSESKEMVNVAMLQPIRSAYLNYKRENLNSVSDIDAAYLEDCRLLSRSGISYHLLDETLIAEDGYVDGDKIGCGLCSYDYLILPHILATDDSTEKLLRKYTENGGKLLILGERPQYCEGESFDYSYLKSNCTLEDIINAQPFHLNNRETCLYNTYREIDDTHFMFIMNSSTTDSYTQTYSFDNDTNSFKKLDLTTLEFENIPLTVSLEPGESILVFLDSSLPKKEKQLNEYHFNLKNAEVLSNSNLLTVDTVRYSKDGITYSDKYNVRELFEELLKLRYEGDIYFKYEFNIRTIPSHITIAAENRETDKFWINGKEFCFDKSSEKEKHLLLSEITNLVQIGVNEYIVKTNWHQSEQAYYALFGENVTESLRNCIVYDSELESIYLSGDFGIYSDMGYETNDSLAFSNDFYIDIMQRSVTEPVTEGFPFYAGSLKLKQKIFLESVFVKLRLNGTWLIAYVNVNGKYAGKMLYNRALDISEFAVQGENTVEIEFIISNRNLLGPHHISKNENKYAFLKLNCD